MSFYPTACQARNQNGFSLESRAVTQAGYPREKPLRLEAMTGLRPGQLTELAARVAASIGDVVKPGGAPAVAGLYRSVAIRISFRTDWLHPARPGQSVSHCPLLTGQVQN